MLVFLLVKFATAAYYGEKQKHKTNNKKDTHEIQ